MTPSLAMLGWSDRYIQSGGARFWWALMLRTIVVQGYLRRPYEPYKSRIGLSTSNQAGNLESDAAKQPTR